MDHLHRYAQEFARNLRRARELLAAGNAESARLAADTAYLYAMSGEQFEELRSFRASLPRKPDADR